MYQGLGLSTPTFADFFNPDGSRRLLTVAMLASMTAAQRALYTDYTTTELSVLMQNNPDLIFTAEGGLFRDAVPLATAVGMAPLAIWSELEPYENVLRTEGGGTVYSGSMVEEPEEGEVVNVGQRYIPPVAPSEPYVDSNEVITPSGETTPTPGLPPGGNIVSPVGPGGGAGGGFPSWGILALVAAGAYILGRK